MIDFLRKKATNIANLPFYNVTITIKEKDIILEKRVFPMMAMSDLISWLEAGMENKNIEVSYEDYHGFSKFINAYFEAGKILDKENKVEENKINQKPNSKGGLVVVTKECKFS